jgi:hypothetical protein
MPKMLLTEEDYSVESRIIPPKKTHHKVLSPCESSMKGGSMSKRTTMTIVCI